MESSRLPRVLIVGAGFGGLALARALRKEPVEVLLVDQNNYHQFQPLLYQVATAGLEPEEIAHAVRDILQGETNMRFRMGTVVNVDRPSKRVILEDGEALWYDYLVLAAGATTNYFGVEGAQRHGFGLKTVEEAIALRSHIIQRFEDADQHPNHIPDGALTFVVVGGGPTGVEMAGALRELFEMVLAADYPDLDVDLARVVLVEATDRLLGGFHEDSSANAEETLRQRGVEVRLNERVVDANAEAVELANGEVIPAHTLVWAAGIKAHPLAKALNVEQTGGGRLVVEADLRLPGEDAVFIIGDLAGSVDEQGELLPQVAPVAMQGGEHVAQQILRLQGGQATEAFQYRDKGMMATIGRHAAVAEIRLGKEVRTKGVIAWIMWLGLHLIMLIGFRNRLQVLVNWVWNYFTYDRSARLIMGDRRTAPKDRSVEPVVPEPTPEPELA